MVGFALNLGNLIQLCFIPPGPFRVFGLFGRLGVGFAQVGSAATALMEKCVFRFVVLQNFWKKDG